MVEIPLGVPAHEFEFWRIGSGLCAEWDGKPNPQRWRNAGGEVAVARSPFVLLGRKRWRLPDALPAPDGVTLAIRRALASDLAGEVRLTALRERLELDSVTAARQRFARVFGVAVDSFHLARAVAALEGALEFSARVRRVESVKLRPPQSFNPRFAADVANPGPALLLDCDRVFALLAPVVAAPVGVALEVP